MLGRPSQRRKKENHTVALNLVPMLDAIVSVIAFLLISMSFIHLVQIDSPIPFSATQEETESDKDPLQLTVTLNEDETIIWSPFEKIRRTGIDHTSDGVPDVYQIHERIVEIKKDFPNETQVVLMPQGGTSYDMLVSVIDSVRLVQKSDPPIYVKNEQGVDQMVQYLFPKVVFGNLRGGGS